MKLTEFTKTDRIYSTGVFLQTVECIINGVKQWRWVSVGFEDDSYFDGKLIEVYDSSSSFEGIIKNSE